MSGQLGILDVVFFVLIFAAAVRSALRGFVSEVGAVAALVLGLAGGLLLSEPLAGVLAKQFGPSMWNRLIAFLILFLGLYVVVKLVENVLHAVIERLNLDCLDRVLGFFLGIAEGILVVGVVVVVLSWQPFFDLHELLSGSLLARLIAPLLPAPDWLPDSRFLNNV